MGGAVFLFKIVFVLEIFIPILIFIGVCRVIVCRFMS